MDNFTPIPVVEKKKKKINKFLVFGNLFLVILVALIGFFYYNNSLISTQQKASFDCDASIPGDCKKKGAAYEGSEKQAADRIAKRQEEQDEKRAREKGELKANGSCPEGFAKCSINGHAFCADNSGEDAQTCNSRSVELGYSTYIGGGATDDSTGAWRCVVGQNGYTGGSCDSRHYAQKLSGCSVPNCFCGTIQIDNCDSINASYYSTCGCNKEEKASVEKTIVGTIVPTPTDSVTNTPTPTPIVNSPTPTPTGVSSGTPTPTPTGTIVPTATPTPTGTPGPTVTPGGPTLTPTEIILASTTPTTVASIPQAGNSSSFLFFIPISIIILGLLL